MNTLWIALRAATFASGFLYLWGWLAWRLRDLGPPLPAWLQFPGALLIAAGAVIALSCIALFVIRGRGTPAPFDAPRQFVATGPYRYVRNPMYVGGLTAAAGFGLYLRSPGILLVAGVFLPAAHLFVIGYEEPTLRDKFRASYEEYCRSVPRWIPARPKP